MTECGDTEKKMTLRRLEKTEHGRTRMLYEEVFSEDDAPFVDYYYRWKVRDNVIYAAEEEGTIVSMVHLNPFRVSLSGTVRTMYYIVAVATREEYRHRGLMRRLLALAEQDAKEKGVCFLFLMPAAEQIYLPFGYRYFCMQRSGWLRVAEDRADFDDGVVCAPACADDFYDLARFANETLAGQYDLFVYRDEEYYRRLSAEQQCQGGAVMVIRRNGQMIGSFCTAREPSDAEVQTKHAEAECSENTEKLALVVREVIFAPQEANYAEAALCRYLSCDGRQEFYRVEGCPEAMGLEREQRKPFLMGKVPGTEVFVPEDLSAVRIFVNEVV